MADGGWPSASGVALGWQIDPVGALARWPAERPVVMLHSGRPDARWARHTILAQPTGAARCDEAGPGRATTRWIGARRDAPVGAWSHEPFADLEALLADPDPLWVGYLGYDLGRFVERLAAPPPDDRGWPLFQLQRCPGWLVYDGIEKRWSAHGAWAHRPPPNLPALAPRDVAFHAGEPTSNRTRAGHEAAVARAIQYIEAGDVFQVNLAHRFTADFRGDPRGLYGALAAVCPAWYGGYVELLTGPGGAAGESPAPASASPRARAIASTSPELFLQLTPAGHVTTRPIKGTRPARAPAAELEHSEKDKAELHMIVDLLRNDLGRVCRYGSVRVTQPRTVESHPTVHHAVATVEGDLRPGVGAVGLLRAALPGGSVTGAPKVRAMEIIDELEPVRRGPYCGCLGWFQGRAAALNIAIRTALVERAAGARGRDPGRVDFSVGGGIVADSTPAGEYDETLDKAAAIRAALRGRGVCPGPRRGPAIKNTGQS